MCDKAVDTHLTTIKYVLECSKAHEMCNNAVHRCFLFDSIPDQYKTEEICFFISFFLIVYCPVEYMTQRMCVEAVDDFLAALNLIPDRFVTSTSIEKLYTALYADQNILCFNEDSGDAVFFYNEMGFFCIDFDNILIIS